MAPEAGLEPATHRLTADCSTIELLWNSKFFVFSTTTTTHRLIPTHRDSTIELLWSSKSFVFPGVSGRAPAIAG